MRDTIRIGLLGLLLMTNSATAAEPTDAQVAAVHAAAVVIDAHVDVPPGFATEKNDPGVDGKSQIDLPKLDKGGVDAAVLAVFAWQQARTPEQDAARLLALRSQLESGLRRTPGLIVFADEVPRLPNTVLFTVPGLRAETAVIGFDLAGISVSSGSACSSGKVQPSHVLEAMGFGPDLAQGAVRLSLGWSTTAQDIDRCLEAWLKLAGTLLKGCDETLLERF